MARQPVATGATSPGRFLAVLAIVIIALGAWMGLTGNHKPKLGLDLQGGTSVTLIPQVANGQGQVTNALVDQAIDIIRQRVNGSGVAEAEITRQGSGGNATIVVSVPGKDQGDLLDKVNQTAQLTFRPVLQQGAGVPSGTAPRLRPRPRRRRELRHRRARPARASAAPRSHLCVAERLCLVCRASAHAGADRGQRLVERLAQPSASPSPSASASASVSQGPAVDPAKLQASTAAALAPVYASIDCTNPANTQASRTTPPSTWSPVTATGRPSSCWLRRRSRAPRSRGRRGSGHAERQRLAGPAPVQEQGDKPVQGHHGQAGQQPLADQRVRGRRLTGWSCRTPTSRTRSSTATRRSAAASPSRRPRTSRTSLKYGALPLSFQTGEVQAISPTLGSDQLHAGLVAGALGLSSWSSTRSSTTAASASSRCSRSRSPAS